MALLRDYSDTIVRRVIMEFYKYTCIYCKSYTPKCGLEIDHIDPVSLGGLNILENYVLACADCNSKKSDCRLEEPGRSLCLTVAKRFAPHILKILKEKRQSHVRYADLQQQLSRNVKSLPQGVKLMPPRGINEPTAWHLYMKLLQCPRRRDVMSRSLIYREIEMDREEVIAFMRDTKLDSQQVLLHGTWLEKVWVIVENQKRKVCKDFFMSNRNGKRIGKDNILTHVYGLQARLLLHPGLVRNYHHLAAA